ncbi:XRE family transcriptional regulator [Gordonia insulae]|uniref:HTH cro/C1-type domain-containing protein n=1 Tax=Gordonia insulae TaxID=2420509 RepID=A0A3G8JER3_9ACTN|nr:XRE family transcriptional regulator [Gordonia insulae]AZG43484.1 hypothetical protein D7316_00049 [Gordonia insulae]
MRLISPQVLSQYMEFRDETNRSLAAKVGRSPSLIAHLRRGARNYCDPKVGPRIEKALNAPPGSLFLPEVIVDSTLGNRNGLPAA